MSDSATAQVHPALTDINKNCFNAMQSRASLALTLPYHIEELERIENLLQTTCQTEKIDNFVAIGCANLRYADLALRYCKNYVAIEPNLVDVISPHNANLVKKESAVYILAKGLEEVQKSELPAGKNIFFFLFNVFPYIPDAREKLAELARPGDIAVVSSWNGLNFDACKLRKNYYSYLAHHFNCNVGHVGAREYMSGLEAETAKSVVIDRRQSRITDILTMRMK